MVNIRSQDVMRCLGMQRLVMDIFAWTFHDLVLEGDSGTFQDFFNSEPGKVLIR